MRTGSQLQGHNDTPSAESPWYFSPSNSVLSGLLRLSFSLLPERRASRNFSCSPVSPSRASRSEYGVGVMEGGVRVYLV